MLKNPPSASTVFSPRGPLITIPMTRMPGAAGLLLKLAALSAFRHASLPDDATLANACMTFNHFMPDPRRLDRFQRVCGCEKSPGTLPAPFIQTLFIGMVSRFIGSPHFPITPLGLIQTGQTFEQHTPLDTNSALDLTCRLVDMTRTGRGIITRISMQAKPAGSKVAAWSGTASYFTRAKHPDPKPGKTIEDTPLPIQETLEIAQDTGRKYAAASGDVNPHHLYNWSAKLFGFKQAIAHGMYSLARSCASMERQLGYPAAFRVQGAFKLPIYLPARITLGCQTQDDGSTEFELRDKGSGLPHLKGLFSVLQAPGDRP